MAKRSEEIVIAGTGTLWVAPAGTTLPTSYGDDLDDLFVDLGFTTEDGATFRDSKTIRESKAWQSQYPVRRTITERSSEVQTVLKQFNRHTFMLAFGGGTIESDGGDGFIYHPPAADEIDDRAVVLDINDGDVMFRIAMSSATVTSNTESKFTRTDDAGLPVTLGVNGQDDEDPWTMFTNSDAFDTDEPS